MSVSSAVTASTVLGNDVFLEALSEVLSLSVQQMLSDSALLTCSDATLATQALCMHHF